MPGQLVQFKEIIKSHQTLQKREPDKHTKKLLLLLFSSTRGGYSRLKIVMQLLETPLNAHQLAQAMDVDYKAIQHHMSVLEKNNIVTKIGEKYGAIYHISEFMEFNIAALDESIEKLERQLNQKKVYY